MFVSAIRARRARRARRAHRTLARDIVVLVVAIRKMSFFSSNKCDNNRLKTHLKLAREHLRMLQQKKGQ